LKQDQIPVFVSSAARAPIKIFSELDSGDVNIHSGAADFSIHFGPERIFTSRRNPYSHHPGTNIHMPRNPQHSFARVFESGYFSFIPKRGRKEQIIPMTQNYRWRKSSVAIALAAFVLVVQAGLMAQNLGTAPQVNVAVQGQQGTQPEGTFLNLINWIGNVIAPVGAGGAALMAIGSFAMGRGFGKWVFTAIGLLMVSGVTRLLEYWIAQGTAGVT
jgi:hypothetical protein